MTEMWERFTYYGMRGILILFLVDAVATGGFGLDDRKATAIYGLYTTATYLMALPGGWLADRLLGAQRAVLWGAALILVGNTLLAVPAGPTLFYVGCLVVVLGVGLLKPNISAMVAQLYPEGGARRDAGFTLFYLGINVGALIGSLATPWLAQQYGWRAGFAGAAVAMALGLVQFQLTRRHLGDAGLRAEADGSGHGCLRSTSLARDCVGGGGAGHAGRVACRRHRVVRSGTRRPVDGRRDPGSDGGLFRLPAVPGGARPRRAQARAGRAGALRFVGVVLGGLRTGWIVHEPVRRAVH